MTIKITYPFFVFGFFFFTTIALAEGGLNIKFPIAELGGCNSKEECKIYCDNPTNTTSCISFAEANGLMNTEEAARARKFAGQTGPGGCRGNECRAFCSDPSHRTECVAFAKEHGLTPPAMREPEIKEPEIDEDKAMQVVEKLGGPGGCRTKEECHAFCDKEANMEVCFAFAVEHNLMPSEDIERARKMMTESGPGGCRGLQCRAYCEDDSHGEECFAFAEKQGLIAPEEAERVRKFMNMTGPGGCRGRECQAYCKDSAHMEECVKFAKEQGFESPEEGDRDDFSPADREFRPADSFEGGVPCSSEEECKKIFQERGGSPEQFEQFRKHFEQGDNFSQPQDQTSEMRIGSGAQGFESQNRFGSSGDSFPRDGFFEPRKFEQGSPGIQGRMMPTDMTFPMRGRYEQREGGFPNRGIEPYLQDGRPGEQDQRHTEGGGSFEVQSSEGYRPAPSDSSGGDPRPSSSGPTSQYPSSNFFAAVFSIFKQLLRL